MITANMDEDDYELNDLKAWKNASPLARNLFENLLNQIDKRLKSEGKNAIFKVVIGGVSAKIFSDQKKAFIFINLLENEVTAKYFTGNTSFSGLRKTKDDYWINKGDDRGSERSRITNLADIKKHEDFASKSYDVRSNW